MSARLIYGNTRTRDYTATADQKAGDLVTLPDNRVGVIADAIKNGQLGAVMIDGVFDIASASATTITAGVGVSLDVDDSNNVIATSAGATGDIASGTALVAKISGDLTVRVDLNAVAGSLHS